MAKNDKDRTHHMSDDLTLIDLFKLLSKPLRAIFAVSMGITGLGILGIFVVVAEFERITEGLKSITLEINTVFFVLLTCIGLFIIGIFIIAYVSIAALMRIKILNQRIKDDADRTIEELSRNISQLNDHVNQLTLSKYILDEDQITDLESEMFSGGHIIVMTSKFHLDTGKLLQIILNNIKRGAIYQYIVPGQKGRGKNKQITGTYHADFTLACNSWWNLFQKDLLCEEAPDIFSTYNLDYQKLKKDALNAGKIEDVKKDAQLYFSNHVQEYLVGTDYSLVTIIMYQKGVATEHNYDIIMKLPTISDGNYYAFKIPDEEKVEKRCLSDIIEAFCRKDPEELNLE